MTNALETGHWTIVEHWYWTLFGQLDSKLVDKMNTHISI